MTPFYAWAARHQIPTAALNDLLAVMGVAYTETDPQYVTGQSEASVQQQVRLEAPRRGIRLWRNNSGVAYDDRGVPVRFGLSNESAAESRVCKSSDLIGQTTTRCPCGHVYGVFTAYECKRPGWVFRESDERAVAQLNFIKLVIAGGGIAKFITGVSEI